MNPAAETTAMNEPAGGAVARRDRVAAAAWAACGFLFWSLVFGLAYTQAPLYYSNQNQYFLHGLAQGGLGHLDDDWLAKTADPTPVFSALVAVTYRYLHENLFYVYYILVLGLYLRTMLGVFDALSAGATGRLGRVVFVTLLVAVHAGLFRLISVLAFGIDYPVYFQSGVAAQYILRFGLQPSVAGVLLVVSFLAWLRDRPVAAAVLAGLAAVFHPTYLLISAIVTLSYLIALIHERRWRWAVVTGGCALLIVSPVVAWSYIEFGPTSTGAFREAQRLLARIRIPHHTSIKSWCDGIALLQVGWIAVAIWLCRGTRLFGVLNVTFVISLGLTLLQLVIDNDTLALLFPWRTSAVLVPLATPIVLTRMIQKLGPWFERCSHGQRIGIRAACGAALAGLVAGGIAITIFGLGYRVNTDEVALLDHVRSTKQRGDVYLLPVTLPKLGTGRRGASAGDFTPPPRGDKNPNQITVDLQRFRLYTGARIFVDFKAVPYKDVEVLEWHRRLNWAAAAYTERNWDAGSTINDAIDHRITCVVVPADRHIESQRLVKVYEDPFYRVYRIQRETDGTP